MQSVIENWRSVGRYIPCDLLVSVCRHCPVKIPILVFCEVISMVHYSGNPRRACTRVTVVVVCMSALFLP